jgi:ferredoxin
VPTIRFETSNQEVSFPEGEEVNLLRIALRNDVAIPFKCASGNCGTDRVRVVEGVDQCVPARRRERERLGDLLDEGYRLSCQTYVKGDIVVAWDPDQTALGATGRAYEQLKQVWLAKDDGE